MTRSIPYKVSLQLFSHEPFPRNSNLWVSISRICSKLFCEQHNLSLIWLKLKLEMFYDDEIKFSSCFPPKTGITNWLKALIKQKHKYKQIKTLKDIFYDLPRYERSGLRERFEMKSGINDYVSFLTVRHPFSRILSAYRNWYHSNCSRL